VSASSSERQIESEFHELTGRECLCVPSGRLALWLAMRCWLRPGDRLLMSPVTDDVVFFTALAAGLRPVMAPVSACDGNIDPRAVPDETWPRLGGVLTTNLYGLPDRVVDLRGRCARLGIPLLEDAAHAVQTEVDGQPIGTFGTASVFSLSKHVAARGGGILAFADSTRRPELELLRAQVTRPRGLRRQVLDVVLPPAEELVHALRLVRPVRHARRVLRLVERTAHRMPLRPHHLEAAIAAAPDLDRFDRWVRVDLHDYRMSPRSFQLRRVHNRLAAARGERARRIEGVRRLGALEAAAPAVRECAPRSLFRVPLLIEDRDRVVGELERHGIGTGYLYDPPLDDYAWPFAEPSPAPMAARWWGEHVLPVDPLDAGRVLGAMKGARLTPAIPPA
jgi:DegT/DnrJ/EryC1/StrS aminotransferase family